MNPDVQLSIAQFTGAWRLMCERSPRYATTRAGNVDLVFSGLPLGFFNVGIVTGDGLSTEALADAARQACGWAASQPVPWLFVVTYDALKGGVDPTATLEACGLVPVMPLTGMITAGVAAARPPEALQLVTPTDDAACAAMVGINGRAYAMDLDAGLELIGKRSFWTDHFPVLGLRDGSPATCAAVMMVDGYRYVALVATEPELQRRGYADAAMRHALAASGAVHGERPTVLHATAAGRPVYERMGYTVLAEHTVFMEKRFLAEH